MKLRRWQSPGFGTHPGFSRNLLKEIQRAPPVSPGHLWQEQPRTEGTEQPDAMHLRLKSPEDELGVLRKPDETSQQGDLDLKRHEVLATERRETQVTGGRFHRQSWHGITEGLTATQRAEASAEFSARGERDEDAAWAEVYGSIVWRRRLSHARLAQVKMAS